MNTIIKLICLLAVLHVTACDTLETEAVTFEFKLLNAQGVETTSFKTEDEIVFRFVIRNNSDKTVKWKFLPNQELKTDLLQSLKRDELLFEVFQDTTYNFIGKPYTSFITTTTARPYEELNPHSSVELQMSWRGNENFFKAFPNYGFVFTNNMNLSTGHYLTGVTRTIEIDGSTRQVYLFQKFSVN